MKKKVLSILAVVLSVMMLVFLTVQMLRIDEKMSQIARPARLFNPKLIESRFPARKEAT